MKYAENIQHQIRSQLKGFEDRLATLPTEMLTGQPAPGSWNALECVEHLNLTLEYYLPQIRKGIARAVSRGQTPNEHFRPGFIGERFARLMRPTDEVVRMRVRTFPRYRPRINGYQKNEVLFRFRDLMEELFVCAGDSQQVDLGKVRVRSAVGNIIRFRLGDLFPVILAHNERHLFQAHKALALVARPTPA